MKYKLLVLDIDGTLANAKKEIVKENIDAVIKAQEAGVKVVVASGRATKGVEPTAKLLNIKDYNGYILSYNGAKIINYGTNETIYDRHLPEGLLSRLYDFSKEHNVNICTYDDESVLTAHANEEYVIKEGTLLKMPIIELKDFVNEAPDMPTKCLMLGDGDKLAELENIAKEYFKDEDVNIFRSEPYFLEFCPKNIDKAFSLGVLLKELNMTREEMVSIGDGFNDLTMIEFAGLGIAMDNAQQAVKDVANCVTDDCENAGVAKAIYKYILEV